MSCTSSLRIAAVFLCILVVTPSAYSQTQCGGFITSCQEPYDHSDGVLKATCRTDSGRLVTTTLDLDPYLANTNGNMVLGGGYEKTCQDFGYIRSSKSFIVIAKCTKFDGSLRKTGFDVNAKISNDNGRLIWGTNC